MPLHLFGRIASAAQRVSRWFVGKPKANPAPAPRIGPQVVRRTPSGRVVPAIATDPDTESRTWTFPPIPVQSSNVRTVAYDYDTRTLEVSFHNGGVYHYAGVPFEIYRGLMGSGSKGSYLHQNVKTPKGLYPYTKVI